MNTYEKIKELCEMKGIAMTKLETELGFGRGSIGKLKKSGTNMSADRLQKVADYFGISIDYLLRDQENLQEDERIILGYYASLNQEGRDELIKHAQILMQIPNYTQDTGSRNESVI